jgi:LPS O-antigen subunit length determinant protein (WzzB/FepE family)
MAFRSWNPKSNSIEYNKRIYDQSSENWIRDYSYPKKSIPSSQESFEVFIENHLSLNEDKKTGFITISIKHQSPFIAKKWNEILINEVNAYYRQKDKSESIDVVNYLNEQILLTSFSEVKEAIAQLLQEETQKLALIEAKQSYVFDFIDPPAVMEKKSEPIRAIICILFSTIGVLFSIFFVIIKNYVFKKNLLKS